MESNPSNIHDSHSDKEYSSDPTIKYIGELLLEEDIDHRPFLYDNFVALIATEASLYNAINQPHADSTNALDSDANQLVRSIFSNDESALLFRKGAEEASKFLPPPSTLTVTYKRKSQHEAADARNSKLPADGGSGIDIDVSILYNEFLLLPTLEMLEVCYPNRNNGTKDKEHNSNEYDLTTQLIICAQAMSSGDFRSASRNLKLIRAHCSRSGDGIQRLSYYLANALEARLAGSTIGVRHFYKFLPEKKASASELLKTVRSLLYGCPMKRFSMAYINDMILDLCAHAHTVHIIDFGILYGYQWPSLIQSLSSRRGKPSPKVRITGIDYPQSGFRPTDQIEETGRRLEKYCEEFGVEFEYNYVAEKSWEKIRMEDLKIREGEIVVVNCLRRLKNLIDDSEEGECQRDLFLSLVRKMKPDMLCYSEANGGYSSPFFLTRFREVLFYYSAKFDIFESTLPRDNRERKILEAEFCGMEAMNAVACEGVERMERPETYKQWQARTCRAGFGMFPLKHSIIETFRKKLKRHYHRDFAIDHDGHWMLQGWKGRILDCTGCWFPV